MIHYLGGEKEKPTSTYNPLRVPATTPPFRSLRAKEEHFEKKKKESTRYAGKGGEGKRITCKPTRGYG